MTPRIENAQRDIRDNKDLAPRNPITGDLDIGDAKGETELKMLGLIFANLSGASEDNLGDVEERKADIVDAQELTKLFMRKKPSVRVVVDGLPTTLTFNALDELTPIGIAKKVESLNRLLADRDALAKLALNMEGKARAEQALRRILGDKAFAEKLQAIRREAK